MSQGMDIVAEVEEQTPGDQTEGTGSGTCIFLLLPLAFDIVIVAGDDELDFAVNEEDALRLAKRRFDDDRGGKEEEAIHCSFFAFWLDVVTGDDDGPPNLPLRLLCQEPNVDTGPGVGLTGSSETKLDLGRTKLTNGRNEVDG
ncbi:hypothetical protein CPC08DRAFT_729602 [Agrocybe pediades]|nr:hypothetical protein CPC08DRAFT_729602 [Agrocybe pediades]